jgi:hypothetical protein
VGRHRGKFGELELGANRWWRVESDEVLDALLALVEPSERGDPESGLRWTCKSVRRLAAELCLQGHQISHTVVAKLLRTLNFSLQANSKTREGTSIRTGMPSFATSTVWRRLH